MGFTYGSIFTGIGAIEIAAEMCGGKPVFMCEQDEFCQRVLRRRFPGVPMFSDVRDVTRDSVKEIKMGRSNHLERAIRTTMYEDGHSLEEIAEQRGVSRQAVWEMLIRTGVELRPQERLGEDNHFYRGGARGSDWAHNKVEKAIERGELVRPDLCSDCAGEGPEYSDGRARIQAHHDDYNKPLEVRWLCKACHHRWHEENEAIAREEVMQTEAEPLVDVLVGGFP